MKRKDAVVSRLTRGVAPSEAGKIKVVQGTATFVDSKTVQVNETARKSAPMRYLSQRLEACSIPGGIDALT